MDPAVGTADAEIKEVRAQGYQRFPLSTPAVGQNVALHAAPAYLVSAFLAHSTSFPPNVSNPQRWNL